MRGGGRSIDRFVAGEATRNLHNNMYRSHRTSRRHHRRHDRGRYYGRHNRYGYYGGGGGSSIIFIVFFFLLIVPILAGSAFFMLIGIGVIVWLLIRRNPSKQKLKQNSEGGIQGRSQIKVDSSGKTPLSQHYYQRPTPEHCQACGSGILSNSTFCTECGTKV